MQKTFLILEETLCLLGGGKFIFHLTSKWQWFPPSLPPFPPSPPPPPRWRSLFGVGGFGVHFLQLVMNDHLILFPFFSRQFLHSLYCTKRKRGTELDLFFVFWLMSEKARKLIPSLETNPLNRNGLPFKRQCQRVYQDFYEWNGVWIIQSNQAKKVELDFFVPSKRISTETDHSLKLVIIGDNSVNKTHFLLSYVQHVMFTNSRYLPPSF